LLQDGVGKERGVRRSKKPLRASVAADSSYETSISFINVQTGQSPAAALNSEF